MKILVPINESKHSLAAVDFVAARSALVGREPEVLLFTAQWPVPRDMVRIVGRGKLRTFHDRSAERVFRPALQTLAKAKLAAQTISVAGHPGREIANAAQKKRVDLIVMASHGQGPVSGFLFGSVTNAVLAHSKTPLLILRDRRVPKQAWLRIGIAVDGSKYGAAAVRFVLKHRALFGLSEKNAPAASSASTVSLIHVVPDFRTVVTTDLGATALPAYTEEQLESMRVSAFESGFAGAREQLRRAGIASDEVRLAGSPGDRIAAFAKEQKLDVLVMGSHGHGAFAAAVLGSVAMRVATKCRTPLLLIRRA
ncbi:MAG TPA: universal stress protein [Burkholderiaceae bacterium]|nr:universal stress protein [Burkholderiaceae bacterium]